MRLILSLAALMTCWMPRFAGASGEPAAPSGTSEAAARAEMLMLGMLDARDRLRQGLVRANGRQFVPSRRAGPIDSEVTLTLAFDWDADVWRCESDEERRVVHSDAGGNFDPGAARQERFRSVCIHTPQQRAAYTQVGNENPSPIEIIAPDDARDRRLFGFLDVRAVCLLFPVNFDRKSPFDNTYRAYAEHPAAAVFDEPNGLTRIEWILYDNIHRRRLWLDRRRGFSPVRLEVADRRITPILDKTKWPDAVCVSTAEWAEKNGVWVPAKYRLDNFQGEDKEGRHEYREFTFEWETVNQPLDKLFEVDSMQAPKGTYVFNSTGQRTVVEKVVGMPGNQWEGVELPEAGETRPSAPKGAGPLRVPLLIAAVVLLFALVILAAISQSRKRRTGS